MGRQSYNLLIPLLTVLEIVTLPMCELRLRVRILAHYLPWHGAVRSRLGLADNFSDSSRSSGVMRIGLSFQSPGRGERRVLCVTPLRSQPSRTEDEPS